MKTTVKIMAFLLVICIIVSGVPFIASAQENYPLIVASNSGCLSGGEVEVEIALKNNPGLVSLSLRLSYDTDVLTLTSVEDMGVLGEQSHKPELKSPYTLVWVNDTAEENFVYDGVIAKLIFAVSPDVEADVISEIELNCDPNNYDVYDKDLNTIDFQTVNGFVDVKSQAMHDLDYDSNCNASDLIVLRKYLFGSVKFDDDLKTRADFSGDTNVDILDLVIFKKLLLGV